MNILEEQIRDLLTAEEARAPQAVALDAVHRGVARRRRHRVGAAAAVVVAAAAAITVPVVLHGSPATPGPGPVATQPAPVPGIVLHSKLSPTWLPAGLVETGRSGQVRSRPDHHPAFLSRYFSSPTPKNQTAVTLTDLTGPTVVPKSATPVTIAGRSGMGWVDPDSHSYVVQVKWSAGHWLYVAAGNGKPAKDIAIHVGNSIAVRDTTLRVPVTCTGTGCKALNDVNVSGARNLLIQLIGDPLMIEVDHSSSTIASNAAIRLHNGMYAHFELAPGAKTHLSHAQLVAISKSFQVHGKLAFSWLGQRP